MLRNIEMLHFCHATLDAELRQAYQFSRYRGFYQRHFATFSCLFRHIDTTLKPLRCSSTADCFHVSISDCDADAVFRR